MYKINCLSLDGQVSLANVRSKHSGTYFGVSMYSMALKVTIFRSTFPIYHVIEGVMYHVDNDL